MRDDSSRLYSDVYINIQAMPGKYSEACGRTQSQPAIQHPIGWRVGKTGPTGGSPSFETSMDLERADSDGDGRGSGVAGRACDSLKESWVVDGGEPGRRRRCGGCTVQAGRRPPVRCAAKRSRTTCRSTRWDGYHADARWTDMRACGGLWKEVARTASSCRRPPGLATG